MNKYNVHSDNQLFVSHSQTQLRYTLSALIYSLIGSVIYSISLFLYG